MNVRYPTLLDDSLYPVRILTPSSGQVTEAIEPLNTAEFSLILDQAVNLRDWVKIYVPHGFSGIYRVVNVSTDHIHKVQQVSLEHGITILGDTVIPETATTVADPDTGGVVTTDFVIDGTMTEVLEELLDYQTATIRGVKPWVVGTVEMTGTVSVTINFSVLLSAIVELVQEYPEYYLSFDQSVFPWRLNVLRKPTTVQAEGRITRNINSVSISYSDANLCTRVISDCLTNKHMDSDNVSVYGIISQHLDLGDPDELVVHDGEDPTERAAEIAQRQAEINAEARRHLDAYDEPELSIDIEGMELSQVTGESLDQFWIGRLFRLALPDYGIVLQERIIGLSYDDLFENYGRVVITLANKVSDLAYSRKNSRTSGSSLYGVNRLVESNTRNTNQVKKESKTGTWQMIKIKKVNDGIEDRLYAAGIVIDPVDGVWLFAKNAGALGNKLSSDFNIQAGRITAVTESVDVLSGRVGTAELNIDAANAAIALKASQTSVDNLTSRVSSAEIAIDGANAAIALKASQSTVDSLASRVTSAELVLDGSNGVAGLIAKVSELADNDENGHARIKAASIIASINRQTGASQVKISADQVDLNGVVAAQVAAIDTLNTKSIAAIGQISATGLISTSNASGMLAPDFTLSGTGESGTSVKNAIASLQIVTSGTGYKLQKKSFNDATWQDVGTFSRATTLSRAWSSGTVTVTASPQGNTLSMGIYNVASGDISWSGNTASFHVYTNLAGHESKYDTGKVLSIDASARYNAGYTAGQNAGYISGYNANKTAYIEESGKALSYSESFTIHARYLDYDGTSARATGNNSSITVTAPSDRYNAGYSSAKLHIDSTNKVIQKSTSGTDVVSISADATISYNSTTHKYTATGTAKASTTIMDTDTAISGTEAYDAGYSAGSSGYTEVEYAKKGLTYRGNAQHFIYDSQLERYSSVGTRYWYSAGNTGWDTLYEKN